jgi:bifunctional UDP-N-acetylglucosamine pyrophosphorylase / glucosamine-1-phosphate N-acetyltransferase
MTDTSLAILVLAAGQSTRMKSATPKVMHKLAGRSLLGHVLANASALAPDRTVIVTSPSIEGEIKSAFPDATVAVQSPALGTAHAVLAAREALADFKGRILVLYGDNPLLLPDTMQKMLDALEADEKTALTVTGFRPADTAGYGRLMLNDEGLLVRIVEHRDANPDELAVRFCNAGFMAFAPGKIFNILDKIGNDNAKGEYYLTDAVEVACAVGQHCRSIECTADEAIGVDSRERLAAAEVAMQKRLRDRVLDGGTTLIDPSTTWLSFDTELGQDVLVEPSVFFGPGVRVDSDVTIKAFSHLEDCQIASGAVIGPYARIRPGTEIGADARIGNFVEVKNASIEAGAKANHLSYVGDARVGAGANLGAGTITCNYDGFLKSHTNIGVGAFVGSNSALIAPVTIGDGAIIGAGSTITKDVGTDAIAVVRADQVERKGLAATFRKRKQEEKDKRKK